jgi:hypothetical protein
MLLTEPTATSGNEEKARQDLRDAYEFARETRGEADTILWEVAAIIWGGQTLLLGFVLEAISGSVQALILIVCVSSVGMLMTVFNEKIMSTRSYVCRTMVRTMAELEVSLGMEIKPQQRLSQDYPTGLQRRWASRVNYTFGVAWAIVLIIVIVTLVWRAHACIHWL